MTATRRTLTAQCLADSAHGVYAPQRFANSMGIHWRLHPTDDGQHQTLRTILASGPAHEHYWDAWQEVLDNAEAGFDDLKWQLYMTDNGDLLAVPVEAAIERLEAAIAACVEYEESHKDAGDGYVHMPRESWSNDYRERMTEACEAIEVDISGLAIEDVEEAALENFEMRSGPAYLADEEAIDSWAVNEIATQLEMGDVGIGDETTFTLAAEACGYHWDERNPNLFYALGSATWHAVLGDQFKAAIAQLREGA